MNNDLKDFYPTPPALIERLLEGFQGQKEYDRVMKYAEYYLVNATQLLLAA
jgi:hypothetical protein